MSKDIDKRFIVKGKCIDKDYWSYGYFVFVEFEDSTEKIELIADINRLEVNSVHKDSLGTYTGLKDNEKNDIYTNVDIVKFDYTKDNETIYDMIGIISYDDFELRMQIEIFNNPEYTVLNYDYKKMANFRIIGNKIDNPELLNEKE